MQVGSVSRIESMGDHVEVTMKLDRDIPIPADVTAVTVSASLLTDRHIELTYLHRRAAVARRRPGADRPHPNPGGVRQDTVDDEQAGRAARRRSG